jgi:hypothetical protein
MNTREMPLTSIRALCRTALAVVALFALPGAARAGSIALAWDPVTDSDVAGYRVHYGPASGNYTQQTDASTSTTITLNGLTDCTAWFMAVKAYDSDGNVSASFSNEITGWPRPTVSGGTPAAAEQGRRLQVTWSGMNFRPGAALRFTGSGFTVHSVNVTSCQSLTADLTVGDTAAVGAATIEVINPDNSYGQGASLFQVQAAVPPTVTGTTPANGATAVSTDAQPQVTFSEPVLPASVTAATVRLLNPSNAAVPQAAGYPQVSADGLTVTLRPAAPLGMGTTYRIQVTGGAGGVSDLASHPLASTFTQATGFTTTDSAGPAITAVAATQIGATSARIDWTTDEAADSQVFYRPTGAASYQQTSVATALVTSHSVLIEGLSPSTGYQVHVRSADGTGNATTSSDVSFTTASSTHTYLTFEAEDGEMTAPMAAISGAGAFGGEWIQNPVGTAVGSTGTPAGKAVFGVHLPVSGTWYLWVRMYGTAANGDSFFESIDAAARAIITTPSVGAWHWVAGRSYTLSAGLHALELGGREAASRADRVLLTTDASFVPTVQPTTDTAPPAAPSALAAAAGHGRIDLSWTNPSAPDLARIVVRFRTDGKYPLTPADGLPAVDRTASPGGAETFAHTGLTNGATHHYAVFALDRDGNVSAAARVLSAPVDNQPPSTVLNLRRTDTAPPPGLQ